MAQAAIPEVRLLSVTHQDIAKAAGVSRGTVDRVLHNRPNVTEVTRRKVLRTAELLGYVKKGSAGENRRVTILIPRWSDSHFNRKISSGLQRAERQLNDESFIVKQRMLENWTSQEMIKAIREEVAEGAQGLILRPENTTEIRSVIREVVQSGIKVITYDADIADCGRTCYIGQDLHLVGQIAAGLLAKLLPPDADILIVLGNLRLEAHKGRVDGFCARLKELGFSTSSLRIVESGEWFDLTEDLLLKELERNGKVRAIYMATQPISSCIASVRKARLSQRPYIICNDLTPTAKRYLRNGEVDFVIDQAFEQESQKAVLAMYSALRSGRGVKKDVFYTDFKIITQEMVR